MGYLGRHCGASSTCEGRYSESKVGGRKGDAQATDSDKGDHKWPRLSAHRFRHSTLMVAGEGEGEGETRSVLRARCVKRGRI